MERSSRVTVIGRSGKTAPVHVARCCLTQQLSGPVTDRKRCVTTQSLAPGLAVGEVGDEEPPHAAKDRAMPSVKIRTFILVLLGWTATIAHLDWADAHSCGHSVTDGLLDEMREPCRRSAMMLETASLSFRRFRPAGRL
jgi:hypothetical protein